MNPWRAALTSATASGKRTRIASLSAIACSSTPPCGCICCSAAAVSSTAVLSVSVANCSRCASWTLSACCSANSRRPRMISSGSPPKGNPKPPPSMRSSLAAYHLQLADQPERADVDQRRNRRQLLLRADEGLLADEEEAGELDIHVTRDDDGGVADDLRDGDPDLVALQRRRSEVEVAVADTHHDARLLAHPPAPGALDVSDERSHPAHRLSAGRLERVREVLGQRYELGVRACGVGERGAIGELLERQPALGRGVAQPDDDLLPFGVGRPLLEFSAHCNGIL